MKKFNFPAGQRLKLRNDFKEVFRSAKKLATPEITLLYKPTDKQQPRLAIVVSKKLGIAVERNRIKRLIREFFRLNKHKLADCDIILYPKNRVSFPDLITTQRVMVKVFTDAGIYKND